MANKNKFKSEAELAEAVVSWLDADGWITYKEVLLGKVGKIADIVAIKNGLIWIVECKLIYGSKVLEQAHHKKLYADFVSVAIPPPGDSLVLDYFRREQGIGKIKVYSNGGRVDVLPHVYESDRPVQNNIKSISRERTMASLREEQKTQKAGSAGGGYVTDYKLTIDRIREYLRINGPTALKDLVTKVPHHYTSNAGARGTLTKRLIETEEGFEFVEISGKKMIALKLG